MFLLFLNCVILKFCNMNSRSSGVSVHTYTYVYVIYRYMRLGIQKLAAGISLPVEA